MYRLATPLEEDDGAPSTSPSLSIPLTSRRIRYQPTFNLLIVVVRLACCTMSPKRSSSRSAASRTKGKSTTTLPSARARDNVAKDNAVVTGATESAADGDDLVLGDTTVASATAAVAEAAGDVVPVSDSVTAAGKGKKKKVEPIPQWKNDSVSPGHPSSMTVLLSWLQDDGNYAKWKGLEGDSQLVLAGDVSQRIQEAKTKVERTPAAVVEKIKGLEKQFRQANDFRLATGQGILDAAAAAAVEEADGNEDAMNLAQKSVTDAILNYCPYYYDLSEVMSDRISTNPTGSYSTTSGIDSAAGLLRAAATRASSDEEDDDAGEKEDGPSSKQLGPGGEATGPAAKKPKLEKGRPSDTGRKFGKADSSKTQRRRSGARHTESRAYSNGSKAH
ncbi:unnamed protein product [Tilletia caries]|uniref:Uncharacterized protein n=1 Tax=Tilletia caries TaxID=13290 RepID=A0A177VDI3_9BASI|nr:hypothetical protein CF335_g7291 [Tilletia laevis]KAE8246966.1 hypothetical protein A4X03_0g7182 [Tilletia caries]CAD6938583.1 unnamed protein product [Tilletia caries]CAD6960882.1 unnamed protein product [Tilletia caries]CAD7061014.1 unnamed protein product [Tilletia caries]